MHNNNTPKAAGAQPTGVQVAGRFYTDAELDNMSEDEVLNLFVEKMIEDKGMGGLEEDLKNEIRMDLKERLIFQINRAIIAALPDDKYEELDKSLDDKTATAESLNQIVAESGVNVAGITQQTMEEFRAVYLSTDASAVRG